MVREHSICCPKCGQRVASEEELMYYVMPKGGVYCPNCNEIVVKPAVQLEW